MVNINIRLIINSQLSTFELQIKYYLIFKQNIQFENEVLTRQVTRQPTRQVTWLVKIRVDSAGWKYQEINFNWLTTALNTYWKMFYAEITEFLVKTNIWDLILNTRWRQIENFTDIWYFLKTWLVSKILHVTFG